VDYASAQRFVLSIIAAMPPAFVPDVLTKTPFTTADAAAAGVSTSALRGGPWRHVFRNVWIHESIEDSREARLDAARLVLGRHAFVCGLTAAWLYGVDARDSRWDLVWVGCPTGSRLRTRTGCYTREISVDVRDLDLINGVLLTTPARTVYDCARWLSPVEALVVADGLAHLGLVTAEEISQYRNAHKGIRDVTRVDAVLRALEPLSESPMETRVRYLLVSSGLPRPTAQHVVRDASGNFVARLDLAYVGIKLAIEYDGTWHWEQRRADDRRRDAIRALGWTVIVVSAEDYRDTPRQVVEHVRSFIRQAA
jgi:very-short-patch-repair endonuclease